MLFSLLIDLHDLHVISNSDNLWENISGREGEEQEEEQEQRQEETRDFSCVIIIEHSDIFAVHNEVKAL